VRAQVDLKLQPAERAALRALNAEERDAVIEELLVQVREDLEWVMARAAASDEAPARPVAAAPRPTRSTPPPIPLRARRG
jgi:hypothetical protein